MLSQYEWEAPKNPASPEEQKHFYLPAIALKNGKGQPESYVILTHEIAKEAGLKFGKELENGIQIVGCVPDDNGQPIKLISLKPSIFFNYMFDQWKNTLYEYEKIAQHYGAKSFTARISNKSKEKLKGDLGAAWENITKVKVNGDFEREDDNNIKMSHTYKCEFLEEIYYKSETTAALRGRPRFLPSVTFLDL